MKIVRVVTGVHVEVDDPLDPVSVPVHLVAGAAHVQAHVLAAEVAEAEHRPRGVLAQQKLLLRVPEQIMWLLVTTMAHYVSHHWCCKRTIGPTRVLLRDCKIFADSLFAALSVILALAV